MANSTEAQSPPASRSHAHGHAHSHGHSHSHGHAHGASDIENNGRKVLLAAVIIGGFMIAEVVGGLISGSLALLADAGHMLSDFASLVLAWFAFHIAKRPATQALSYGTDRFQVLAAFVNGMTLIFLCLWIFVEAVQRFLAPVDILSGTMMAIAILGLLVNVTAFLILSSADRDNLNIRGAMMHVVGDIFGSIATIAAAGMIMVTGWTVADPILSLLVVALILRGAYYIVKDSGHILLEGTPAFLDPEDIERDLTDNVDDLEDVHHFHIWSITQGRSIVTLHAKTSGNAAPDRVIRDVKERLRLRFGIDHSTVEIEFDDCADAFVNPNPGKKPAAS